MISKVIKIPIYDAKFKVYIGDVQEVAKKYDISISRGVLGCMARNYKGKSYKRIIALPSEINIGTIVHECTHLVNDILSYVGYELDFDNDEHYCYLLDYVVQKVYNLYPKSK